MVKYTGFHPLKCLCCCITIPQRVIVALLMHLALQNSYNLRVVLNVAIVEMVEPPKMSNKTEVACPMFHYEYKQREGGSYPWPRAAEARILYAFYVGYFLSHVPMGYVADEYGSRHVLGISMILALITTLIFPTCIQKGGQWAAVGLRFFLGLVQGSIMPCISSMVSHWIPEYERPFLGALAYSGSNLGTILGNAFTGVIIQQTNSWPMAFYVWSGVTVAYIIFHYLYIFSFPNTHPFLPEEELTFLNEHVVVKKRKKTPWKAILTNVPYWANVAGHFGHNYIFYTLVTFLPIYMKEILRFDIQSNAFYSALPFLALWLGSLSIGALANVVINRGLITRHLFGQIFGTMGNWGSALAALGAVYVGCNRTIVIALFVLSLFLKCLYYMTMTNNINELSRNYGGILFAVNNGLNSLTGVIGSALIGAITKNGRLSEWKLAFWITFGISIVSSIIYILWTSSERQAFDYEEEEEIPEK